MQKVSATLNGVGVTTGFEGVLIFNVGSWSFSYAEGGRGGGGRHIL